ncbi:MAG: site-specific integrase, partial [Methanobacteriota archaeon]
NGMMYDIILIAIETAMRRGEIASMEWRYVDLRRRVVHLPDTKNGESRDVPLSTRAVEVLQARSKVRNLKDSRVFPLRSDAIGLAFRRICRRAGIEGLRFHDLRHEATTRMAERLHPLELARVTGHRDTKMLLRYYNPRAEDLARKLG